MRDAVTTRATEHSRSAVDAQTLVGVLRRTAGADTGWLRRLERVTDDAGYAREPATVDRALVTALRAATGHLRRADSQVGSAVRSAAECHLKLAAELLDSEPVTGAVQRDLAQVVGDVAQLAGWLAFDAGETGLAEDHYRTGLRAARLAGDHALSAYLVAHTAHLLACLGETGEALAATTIIRQLTTRRTTAATQAHAAAVEADIHARRGDGEQALRDLDRAERWLGRIVTPREPGWLSSFGRGDLLGWRGEVWMSLNDPRMACAALEERLTLLGPSFTRDRALTYATLASAHVREQRVEDAATLALQALELAYLVGSVRAVERVMLLASELEPHAASQAVRRLNERLGVARRSA